MTVYFKSEYEKAQELAVSANLSAITANVSILSGNITTISSNITSLNDFVSVTVSTAVFTLDLSTYRNFTITNTETSGKTLKIANSQTASDTMLNVNLKLTFSATATFTYTGTITWSVGTAASTLAPSPTAVGTFILNLKSFDAGTTWLGTYHGLY
jgi:hypothetical protein